MAASANDIRAGRGFVEIGIEGIEQAKAKLAALGSAFQALGTALALKFATSKVLGWVDSVAEGGRELYLTSRQMQMSVEELQIMKKVGQELGIEFESMQMAVNKVRQYVADLAVSGQQSNDTMRELGLTLSEVADLSDLDRMQKFGERIRALGNPEMTARIGRQIFGRGGIAIAASAADFGAARQNAQGGVGLTRDQVQDAFELSQSMRAFDRAVASVGKAIGAALVPGFRAVYDYITPIVKSVRNWVVTNQALVQKIALIGGIVVGVSAALIAVATAFGLAGMAIAGIAAVFTSLWAIVTIVAGIVAFAFTPIGAAIVATVALVGYLAYASGLLDKIAGLGTGLERIFNDAFAGIKDAIVGGELGLAWEVALQGMTVAWYQFNQNLTNSFGNNLIDVIWGIRSVWAEAVFAMRALWATLAFEVASVGVGIEQAATFLNNPIGAANDLASGNANSPLIAAAQAHADRLVQIAQDRNNALAVIDADSLIGPGELTDALMRSEIELANLLEMASISVGEAQARRDAATGPAQRGLEEFASKNMAARGTFSRESLFGFGASPVQQLVDVARQQLERLDMLEDIRDELGNLNLAVS